jgi:hypothetical protein
MSGDTTLCKFLWLALIHVVLHIHVSWGWG